MRDTPGINYRVIRNARGYNCKAILWRTRARSKYGTKRMLVNRFEFMRSRVDRLDYEIGILHKRLTKSQLDYLDNLYSTEYIHKKKISEKNLKKLQKKEARRVRVEKKKNYV